jgi:hypothetical protein
MKIRKVLAAAAVAGSVAVLAPQAASAGQVGSSFTLPAGSRVCVDDPALSYTSAGAIGWASQGVKFTFLVRPLGSSTYALLAETGDNATSFGPQSNRFIHPWAYPGNFRVCARNNGGSAAQVQLSINAY